MLRCIVLCVRRRLNAPNPPIRSSATSVSSSSSSSSRSSIVRLQRAHMAWKSAGQRVVEPGGCCGRSLIRCDVDVDDTLTHTDYNTAIMIDDKPYNLGLWDTGIVLEPRSSQIPVATHQTDSFSCLVHFEYSWPRGMISLSLSLSLSRGRGRFLCVCHTDAPQLSHSCACSPSSRT